MNMNEFSALTSATGIIVAKFGAEWCMPCKALRRTIDSMVSEFPDVRFIEIDVENSPEVANEFGITSVPTLIYFCNGEIVDMSVGNVSKGEISKMISKIVNHAREIN